MEEDSSTNKGLNLKGIELNSAGPIHLAVAVGNIENFLEELRKAEEAFKSTHEEDLSDEKPSLDDFINPGAKIFIDLTYLFTKDLPSDSDSDSDSSLRETSNVTPLHVAAFLGHVKIFEILFDKVQLPTFACKRLLNKPYENEVALIGQNPSLKYCKHLEL